MARKVVRSAVVVINVWRLTLYAADDRRPTDCETSPGEFLLRITVPAVFPLLPNESPELRRFVFDWDVPGSVGSATVAVGPRCQVNNTRI